MMAIFDFPYNIDCLTSHSVSFNLQPMYRITSKKAEDLLREGEYRLFTYNASKGISPPDAHSDTITF